jgi:hypothetical protein
MEATLNSKIRGFWHQCLKPLLWLLLPHWLLCRIYLLVLPRGQVCDMYYDLHLLQYSLFWNLLAHLSLLIETDSSCIFKNNTKTTDTLSQWTYLNWHWVTEIVTPKWTQNVSTCFWTFTVCTFYLYPRITSISKTSSTVDTSYHPDWDTFESERECYL